VHCLFQNGYTALMDAAELGNTTLVEMLVKARARTDLKTKVIPASIRQGVVSASEICAVSVGRSSAYCLSLIHSTNLNYRVGEPSQKWPKPRRSRP
jgi:ankyrin repeat protein